MKDTLAKRPLERRKNECFTTKQVYETTAKWIPLTVFPTQPWALAEHPSAAFNEYNFQKKAHHVMKMGYLSCALILTIKTNNAESLKKQRIAWTSISKSSFEDSYPFETLYLSGLWVPKTFIITEKMEHAYSTSTL